MKELKYPSILSITGGIFGISMGMSYFLGAHRRLGFLEVSGYFFCSYDRAGRIFDRVNFLGIASLFFSSPNAFTGRYQSYQIKSGFIDFFSSAAGVIKRIKGAWR